MTTSAEVSDEAFGLCGNKDLKHGTEVKQCCSSALWVPIEVLEDGYGHGIGLWGLGHGLPRPSPPPSSRG